MGTPARPACQRPPRGHAGAASAVNAALRYLVIPCFSLKKSGPARLTDLGIKMMPIISTTQNASDLPSRIKADRPWSRES